MTLYPALSPTLDEDPDQSGRGPQHPDQDPDYPNDDPDHPVHDPEQPEEENPDSSADEWLPVNNNTSNNTVHMSSSHSSSSSSSSDEHNGLSKGGKLEDNEPSEGAGTSIDLGTPWYSTGSTVAESSVDLGERQGTDRFSWKDLRSTGKMLLVGSLTSQQHASVSQVRICSDNFTCCHTEIEVANQTFHLTQSQYTDTGPTSPRADPITPVTWQGIHWSANF